MNFEQEALLTLLGGPDAVQAIKSNEATHTFNRLPIKGPKVETEKLGFVFGEVIDDLFISVVPPQGWYIKHKESYHSYIFDNQNRERGYMFYKGVFYDREAFYRLNTRYYVEFDPEPMPTMIKEKRWCRTYKESGYDRIAEVMPRGWAPPKLVHSYNSTTYEAITTPSYKFMETDCYEVEPKPYDERCHRYVAKDRSTGEVLLLGKWIKNGDYSNEAKAKEDHVRSWLKDNYPEYENAMEYW